jgi:DNA repair exonuclease SbcCD nuclease subunit
MSKKPLVIFTSDIHLSDKKPICRKEDDWLEYQREKLAWLADLKYKLDCELIIAGDLFDKYSTSHELMNMAVDSLPPCRILCGNHELKFHSMELFDKSCLGSLTRYDKFTLMEDSFSIGDFEFVPFHFGDEFKSYEGDKRGVAMIHHLIWSNEPFVGAPKDGNIKNLVKKLKGFEIIDAGDNHGGFVESVGDTTVVNNGSLFRLTSNQINYQPSVWVLYDDGSVESIDVPVENDKISREHLEVKEIKDERIKDFVEGLKSGVDIAHDLNFIENLKVHLKANDIDDSVVELLEEASDCNLK